jgi:geranylgeranyl diphosphate synthase type II
MLTIIDAQKLINEEIKKLIFADEPKELYEPIKYMLLLGGKRARPSLTLLACNLYKDDVLQAMKPAIGLEIFHNFTLLHDDIMDNANVRRGKQTVNNKWNTNVAILSGDAMCIKAYEFIADCDCNYFKEVFEIYNYTALKVCEGQQLDMNFETREKVTVDEYLQMIELKTSSLFAACLKIGAIIGGASKDDAAHLYNFGLNLGLAFQLQDDLLDVFSDEVILGKEIGKDIVSNKKTFLLIKALELAKGKQLEILNHWLSVKKFNVEEKIKAFQVNYMQLKIREITLKTIESYFLKALEELRKVNVSEEKKIELKNFLYSLRNRKY